MGVRLNPYLSFRDDAREAMEFYHSIFGGELTVSTFGEMHASENPDEDHRIMHAMLETDDGLVLMGADTPSGTEHTPAAGFAISLSGDDEGALRGYFDALSANGTVTLPLERAPWGDSFGMCTDPFGVSWMVNISGEGA